MAINVEAFAKDVTQRRRLQPYKLSELGLRPRRPALVKRLLDSTAMSVIFGESGCGKTFFALDCAFHIALGRDWFGRRIRGGAVYYLAAEGGYGIEARVAAWKQYHGLTEDPPLFVFPGDAALTGADTDTEALISEIQRLGQPVVFIAIDTMSRVFNGANENAPDAMGEFVRNIDRIRTETGAHVTVVHHAGKDTARGARGHSILRAAADTEIEIVHDAASKIVTATVTKQRDHEAGQPFGFRLEPVEIGRDEEGERITSCVVVPVDELPDSKPRITGQARVALDLLRKLISEAGEDAPASNHIPRKKVVRTDLWRSYFDKASVVSSDKPDSKERAFNRAAQKLQELGFAHTWDGWAWLSD